MIWRLNRRARAVLAVFLTEPSARRHTNDLCEAAKIGSGTANPLLAWMEQHGWIDSDWDDGEPRRRVYWMTGAGERRAKAALASNPEPTGWSRVWRWFW